MVREPPRGSENSVQAGTEANAPGTAQEISPWEDPSVLEGCEDLVPPKASSSSSPDEVVVGLSATLPAMDNIAEQEFFRRVAQNLGL